MSATGCPLSIVIVSWNTRDLLAACLRALAAPGGMPEGTEVIVVDNASSDDSVTYTREHFPWVRIIERATNSGFAAATNSGLAAARGAHLLLLNSDTEVTPGALAAMVTLLRRSPKTGIVGADVRNPDGSPQPCAGAAPSLGSEIAAILGLDRRLSLRRRQKAERCAREGRKERRQSFLPSAFCLLPSRPGETYRECDWVLGAALMFRREVYAAIGPLDTGYFFYSEEVDWCTRARAGGWRVGTLGGARVLHHGGGSTRRTADRMRPALFRSKIRYLAIHRGRGAARVFRSVVRAVATLHIINARLLRGQARGEEASWLAVRQSV